MALKTLADCKPSEFMVQTCKIKKSVSKWLTDTDILSIRQRMPQLVSVEKGASAEKRAEAITANAAAMKEQSRKNLSAMFDAAFENHPAETLEVMALCCFVEPEDVDNHSMSEYLTAFTKLISNEAVIGFFTSLAQLGQTGILTGANR